MVTKNEAPDCQDDLGKHRSAWHRCLNVVSFSEIRGVLKLIWFGH